MLVRDLKQRLENADDRQTVIFESHEPGLEVEESYSVDETEDRGDFFVLIGED